MVRALGPHERRLVRELQDIKGNQLEYREIGSWVLTGNGKPHRSKRNPCRPATCTEHVPYKLTSKALVNNGMEGVFNEVDLKVQQEFTDQLQSVVESQFRTMINEALNDWGATPMRDTGGVYFVPEQFSKLLGKFNKLFAWLNKSVRTSTEVELVTIPVVNEDDQRELVENKYETQAAKELYSLIDEARDVLKAAKNGDKVSPRTINTLRTKYEQAKQNKQYYEKLLNSKMSKTQAALKIAQNQLKQLATAGLPEL